MAGRAPREANILLYYTVHCRFECAYWVLSPSKDYANPFVEHAKIAADPNIRSLSKPAIA